MEQHSLRSFLGFTTLVQISTREEDYLVDTIALHDFIGILRPVFASPSICKVFHGADNDVVWLQRDFHIYIVNLFDTSKACEVLSKPQKSLAYLLETYCGVTTNKLLQELGEPKQSIESKKRQYHNMDLQSSLTQERDKIEEALSLAELSAEKPHFSHCLEWLLFTVFEADISKYFHLEMLVLKKWDRID